MLKQKRGLSDVVTVSLIILLAIAAVVIVWSFVRPTIEKTGKQIAGENCLTVDVKPISCDLTSNSVVVENGPGEATVDKVKLVYYQTAAGGSNSEVIADATGCDDIAPLERKTCIVTNEPYGGAPAQVSVAAVLGEKVCPISTEKVDCA